MNPFSKIFLSDLEHTKSGRVVFTVLIILLLVWGVYDYFSIEKTCLRKVERLTILRAEREGRSVNEISGRDQTTNESLIKFCIENAAQK